MKRHEYGGWKRTAVWLALLLFVVCMHPTGALAASDYNYNSNGIGQKAPTAYVVSRKIDAHTLGVDSLQVITSLFVTKESIYIACADKIIVTDREFQIQHILSAYTADGVQQAIQAPQGIFVTQDVYKRQVLDPVGFLRQWSGHHHVRRGAGLHESWDC